MSRNAAARETKPITALNEGQTKALTEYGRTAGFLRNSRSVVQF